MLRKSLERALSQVFGRHVESSTENMAVPHFGIAPISSIALFKGFTLISSIFNILAILFKLISENLGNLSPW